MRRYEGLFLFDTAVARDWPSMEEEVRRICGRIGAELLVCVKFDERKLAYEIAKRKRGTYALAYFEAPPEKLAEMERDVRLSESILRAMIVRAETLTEERLAQLRAHPADTSLAPMVSESRRHDDDRRHDRRGGWRDRDRGERGPERGGEGAPERGGEGEVAEPAGAPAESGAGGPEAGYEREPQA